ncbi:hypothetical protein L6248_02395 [Candidatus Parcubacteria bacterium]|nr:hypothetical protein [Candidatus Parcubacteria bacterium]MCG2700720.1 hypothetical protein [Candidatus Parcubacteria bacterium]
MKNINNSKSKRDAMAIARKHSLFKKYSQEARARILLTFFVFLANL